MTIANHISPLVQLGESPVSPLIQSLPQWEQWKSISKDESLISVLIHGTFTQDWLSETVQKQAGRWIDGKTNLEIQPHEIIAQKGNIQASASFQGPLQLGLFTINLKGKIVIVGNLIPSEDKQSVLLTNLSFQLEGLKSFQRGMSRFLRLTIRKKLKNSLNHLLRTQIQKQHQLIKEVLTDIQIQEGIILGIDLLRYEIETVGTYPGEVRVQILAKGNSMLTIEKIV